MTPDAPLAEVWNYQDLQNALRERKRNLQMTCEDIDAIAGWPDRYAGKLFGRSQNRRLGRLSLGVMLTALGVKILIVEDREATRKIASRASPRIRHRIERRSA